MVLIETLDVLLNFRALQQGCNNEGMDNSDNCRLSGPSKKLENMQYLITCDNVRGKIRANS